jgi:hypothetical protein
MPQSLARTVSVAELLEHLKTETSMSVMRGIEEERPARWAGNTGLVAILFGTIIA